MGQAAGKALSVDRHGSFHRNSKRMWAHCRLLLTCPLAAVLEVVIQAAPTSLEGTIAKYTHGRAKCLSFCSSHPWNEPQEMGWGNVMVTFFVMRPWPQG